MNISELFTTLYINIPSMLTASGGPPQKKSWKSWYDHWSLDKRAKIYAEPQWQQLNDNSTTFCRETARQLETLPPKGHSKVQSRYQSMHQQSACCLREKKLRQVDKLITKKQTTSSCSCQFLPETSTEIPKRSSSSHLQNVHNRSSFLNSERLKHVRPGTVQSSVAPSGA